MAPNTRSSGPFLGRSTVAALLFDGEHSLTIVILFAYTEPLGRRAWMKPELSPVVLGLLIAGFAFAVVLALVRVHPAELEAPGLKFVSPGIARK